MTEPVASFDVVVLGGGPAGAAAATMLGRLGVRSLLVDQTDGLRCSVGEGLPPASRPLLRELGLWNRMESDGHRRSHGNESAWGDSTLRSTSFVRSPNGHGWLLDRPRFDARLRRAAEEAGTKVRMSTQACAVVRTTAGWRLTLQDRGATAAVHTRWLIDCTGRRGWAARAAGAARVSDDRLIASVSSFAPVRHDDKDADRDSLTLVESVPDGWWYTSRLPGGDRLVVYLTDAHDPSAALARTRRGFLALLDETQHIHARVARGYFSDGPPRIVSAATSRLVRPAGDGWLAAGDAAVSFDPLSSQGIVAAIDCGMRAAETVHAHLSGDRRAIDQYVARIEAVYAAYVRLKDEYYACERRWAGRPFWSIRQDRRRADRPARDAGSAYA